MINNVSKKILIINGSIRGDGGNSGAMARIAEEFVRSELKASAQILTLAGHKYSAKQLFDILNDSDGFFVISGVYWNNWGSPLQRLIEISTAFENSPAFFGKPVACAFSSDSRGGMEIAARLHSVFSGLGCWSPPCSTLIISRISEEAIKSSEEDGSNRNEDVWSIKDINVVLKNLVIATRIKHDDWLCWPHSKLELDEDELTENGILDMSSPKFL